MLGPGDIGPPYLYEIKKKGDLQPAPRSTETLMRDSTRLYWVTVHKTAEASQVLFYVVPMK